VKKVKKSKKREKKQGKKKNCVDKAKIYALEQ
jgi:hypothetical protein